MAQPAPCIHQAQRPMTAEDERLLPPGATLDLIEHTRPVSRRQLGWHSLRLLAMGHLLGPDAAVADPPRGVPHTEAGGNGWLPGQALQVLSLQDAESIQHEPSTLALRLRGRSYSHLGLLVAVPEALSAASTGRRLAISWQCQRGTGVDMKTLQLLDGPQPLQCINLSAQAGDRAVFNPVASVQHRLLLRWDLQFADTERDLRWQHLLFALN
jgi:hypothetical protein